MTGSIDLSVLVFGDDLDGEQLDESTRRLRLELLDLDVERVTSGAGGCAPAGTRGLDVEAVGQLMVGVGAGLDALRRVLVTVRAWRAKQRCVRIQLRIGDDQLELTDASPQSEEQVVEAFLRRHAADRPGDSTT
jgi:hypothetical protein